MAPNARALPITRGLKDGDLWGPTDVYAVRLPLPGDSQPVIKFRSNDYWKQKALRPSAFRME